MINLHPSEHHEHAPPDGSMQPALIMPGVLTSEEAHYALGEPTYFKMLDSLAPVPEPHRTNIMHERHDRTLAGAEAVHRMVHLEYAATHDALTGLPNRRALDTYLADPSNDVQGILYVDVDGFKGVNDKYGHAMGDALLKAFGQRLRDRMRAEDMVVRIGGDEFVVVLGPTTTEMVTTNQENVRELVKSPDDVVEGAEKRMVAEVVSFITPGKVSLEIADAARDLAILTAVGASTGDVRKQPGETNQELLSRADEAMYERKRDRDNSRAGVLTPLPASAYEKPLVRPKELSA